MLNNSNQRQEYLQEVRLLLEKRHTNEWSSALQQLREIERPLLLAMLTEMLSDPDSEIRDGVAEALLRIEPGAGIPRVLSLTKDPQSHVRWYVCGLLHDFGDERAIEPLIELIRTDPDSDVRYIACYALGEIGDMRALAPLQWVQQNDQGMDYEGRRVSEMAWEAIQSILAREHDRR